MCGRKPLISAIRGERFIVQALVKLERDHVTAGRSKQIDSPRKNSSRRRTLRSKLSAISNRLRSSAISAII